jgi:nucleotide-binding universal stress UspA family protein
MKVILGVDDSTFSEDAVRYVSEAIWPKQTSFLVLSAVAPLLLGPGEALAPYAIADVMEEQRQYHREIAERAAARLRDAGMTVTPRMVSGDPRTVLEEAARSERADLIVVGSHGRSGIKKLLLGSVASHIVTHAPCTVLVVKSPTWSPRSVDRKQVERMVAACNGWSSSSPACAGK